MVLTTRDWSWIVGMVLLDQATKIAALLTEPHNFLFELTTNTGAGFGILQDKNWLLLFVSILVLILIWKPLTDSKGNNHFAYMMLAAGVAGNSIDRIAHRHVIDFISVGNFPVFNVADALITLSVLYLVATALQHSFRSWNFRRKK